MTYLYVLEIARVNGKPKVISQTYIGSPEKVASLVRGRLGGDVTLKVEEFGALWLFHEIDRHIDLCSIIDKIVPPADRETGPSIGEYFLYCVFKRLSPYYGNSRNIGQFFHTGLEYGLPT